MEGSGALREAYGCAHIHVLVLVVGLQIKYERLAAAGGETRSAADKEAVDDGKET